MSIRNFVVDVASSTVDRSTSRLGGFIGVTVLAVDLVILTAAAGVVSSVSAATNRD